MDGILELRSAENGVLQLAAAQPSLMAHLTYIFVLYATEET